MTTRPIGLAALPLLLLLACDRSKVDSPSIAGATGTPALVSRENEIDNTKLLTWLRAEVAEHPGTGFRPRLIDILLNRGLLRGNLADFEECIRVTDGAIEHGATADMLRARAKAKMALHRFKSAEEDLQRASNMPDALPGETRALLGEIALESGKYDEALATFKKAAEQSKTYVGYARLANLELELGNPAEADRLYDEAERALPPGNAPHRAWLHAQRGNRHFETGDWEKAKVRYAKALSLDPHSFLANEGIAQVEALLGDVASASARYQKDIDQSDSTEAIARLARLSGKKELEDGAWKRYEAELTAFPDALWMHAGMFLLETGRDPKKAVELLEKNAAQRPNATAWMWLARAQLAAGDRAKAKQTIDRALATPVKTARLFWIASEIHEKKPDEFAKKAKALNPRISEMMPAPKSGA